MATSLTTLKARVATELHRTDLTSEIATAISSAILQYQSRRFEFNQRQTTFNTADGTESYTTSTIPDDIAQIDVLRITVNGHRYPLRPITFAELQELSNRTTNEGPPSKFAFYAQTIFLYPIPDATYSVQISYLQREDPPANDADTSSVWTNAAGDLICANAKKRVARNNIYDDKLAMRCEAEESEALSILLNESVQLQDDGSALAVND